MCVICNCCFCYVASLVCVIFEGSRANLIFFIVTMIAILSPIPYLTKHYKHHRTGEPSGADRGGRLRARRRPAGIHTMVINALCFGLVFVVLHRNSFALLYDATYRLSLSHYNHRTCFESSCFTTTITTTILTGVGTTHHCDSSPQHRRLGLESLRRLPSERQKLHCVGRLGQQHLRVSLLLIVPSRRSACQSGTHREIAQC